MRKAPVRKPPRKERVAPAKPKPKPKEGPVLTAAGRTPAAQAASPDTLLLIGGLALFVLVLGDTVFLTLSTRFLGGAR